MAITPPSNVFGEWLGGEVVTDSNATDDVAPSGGGVALPYPEATYWGLLTGFKVFRPLIAALLDWSSIVLNWSDTATDWSEG